MRCADRCRKVAAPIATTSYTGGPTRWTPRIFDRNFSARGVGAVPIGRPFPDVARHVLEPERGVTRPKSTHRRSRRPPIIGWIHRSRRHADPPQHHRALATTCVQQGWSRRRVAPWIDAAVGSASCVLPLSLAWESRSTPTAVRLCRMPIHTIDRVVRAIVPRSVARMTINAADLLGDPRIVGCCGCRLTGACTYAPLIGRDRHGSAIHAECVQPNPMSRAFVRSTFPRLRAH